MQRKNRQPPPTQRINNLLIKRIILLVLVASVVSHLAFANNRHKEHYPDSFTRQNITIQADQTIGRLFVDHSDAVVAGQVTKGIIIVEGNLSIQKNARIQGFVFVTGGQVTMEQGAYVHNKIWTVPVHFPDNDAWLFLLPGLIALMILLVGWGLVKIVRRSAFFARLREALATLLERWPVLYILATFLTTGFLLALFAELTRETLFQHEMDFFDNVVIWFVRYFASTNLDAIMLKITYLGSAPFYGMLATIVLLALSAYRRWREVSALAICLIGGAILNYLLKNTFERARPDLFRVIDETGYSFPSGHAMVSLCFYGMLAYLISRNISSWRWRMTLLTLTAAFILAIGISRIYLGVHYPTDVLAGYSAGSTWLFFCISLLMWWEHKQMKKGM